MTYRDPVIESCKCAAKHSRGIALHKHCIGLFNTEIVMQTFHSTRCKTGKSLIGPHEIQIAIRCNLEDIQDLIQHLTVLSRYANPAVKSPVCF
jgi:hypothetical protein